MLNASNVAGALGTDPTSVSTYYTARQQMEENACPPGPRCMNISSSMMATLGTNITSIFHPADEITRMWKKGAIGGLAGYQFFESNSLYSFTAGTWAGTVKVVGAGQSGSTLIISGTNGDTIKQGDKFNIANVNKTNPMTYRIAGKAALKTFTATQAYTLTGGNDTISILPAIYGPGSQYQNVDSLPADQAALTLWPGTTSPNGKVGTVGLALSKYAFAFAGAKLYVPQAVEKSGFAYDKKTQVGVRKVKASGSGAVDADRPHRPARRIRQPVPRQRRRLRPRSLTALNKPRTGPQGPGALKGKTIQMKNTINAFLISAALLFAAIPGRAQATLTQTTLSSAIADDVTRTVVVASTTCTPCTAELSPPASRTWSSIAS